MSDFMSNVMKRLNQKMSERTAETKSGRFDFYLSDWEVIGDHEARILVGYQKELGLPKTSQLDEWVIENFNGTLRLAMESLRNYPQMQAISGVVIRTAHTLPYDYSKKMIPVSATAAGGERFQDDAARIWEAMTNDSGDLFLVRVARDDIAEILAKRQERVGSFAHKRPRLVALAGISTPEIGDQISFMDRGIRQRGEVTHVGEKVVHVFSSNEEFVVPRGAVIAVHHKSSAADAAHNKRLVDFFAKQYGDRGFAQKLVTLKGTGTGSDD